jgi:hypothetical protein
MKSVYGIWTMIQNVSSTVSGNNNGIDCNSTGSVFAVSGGNGVMTYRSSDGNTWTSGEAFGVASTSLIQMNSAGTRVFVLDNSGNANYVRVYDYSAGSWSLTASIYTGALSNGAISDIGISKDGLSLYIGCPNHLVSTNPVGAVHRYTCSGVTWTLQSSTIGTTNYFGTEVVVSGNGTTVFVSAYSTSPANHYYITMYSGTMVPQVNIDLGSYGLSSIATNNTASKMVAYNTIGKLNVYSITGSTLTLQSQISTAFSEGAVNDLGDCIAVTTTNNFTSQWYR